jgi:hypothetical protein
MQRPRGITPLQGIITIIARNFSRKVAGQERDLPQAEQSDLLEVPRSARQNTVVI